MDAGEFILVDANAGSILNRIQGGAANDQFGSVFNRDTDSSNNTLLLSAPQADIAGMVNAGEVVMVDAATGVVINRIQGSNAGDAVGDGGVDTFFGPNFDDLLIRVPDASPNGLAGAGSVLYVDGATGNLINRLDGVAAGDGFGALFPRLLANGNLLFRSPNADVGGLVDVGTLVVTDPNLVEVGRSNGQSAGELLGAVSPDTFSTGPDPIFFDQFADTNGLINNGSIVKVSQDTGQVLLRIAGTESNERLGGDRTNLNGDDVLVASENADFGGLVDSGRVFLISDTAGGGGLSGNQLFADGLGSSQAVAAGSILSILDSGADLVLQANSDILLALGADLFVNAGGSGGNLTLQAGRSVTLNASIDTDNGDLKIVANETSANGVVTSDRAEGPANIIQAAGTMIDTGTGNLSIIIADGAGRTGARAEGGVMQLQNLFGNNISLINKGSHGLIEVTAGLSSALVSAQSVLNITAGDLLVQGGDFSAGFAHLDGGSQLDIEVLRSVLLAGGSGGNASAILESHTGNVSIIAGSLQLPGSVTLMAGSGVDADALVAANHGEGSVTVTAGECVNCDLLDVSPFSNLVSDDGVFAAELLFNQLVGTAAQTSVAIDAVVSMLPGEEPIPSVVDPPVTEGSGAEDDEDELLCSG